VEIVVQLATTKLEEVAGIEVVFQVLVVVVKKRSAIPVSCN
jgi:hypothetical protein